MLKAVTPPPSFNIIFKSKFETCFIYRSQYLHESVCIHHVLATEAVQAFFKFWAYIVLNLFELGFKGVIFGSWMIHHTKFQFLEICETFSKF